MRLADTEMKFFGLRNIIIIVAVFVFFFLIIMKVTTVRIPGDKIGIQVDKWGKSKAPGRILAEKSQVGVQRKVWKPGLYFFKRNPFKTKIELHDWTKIGGVKYKFDEGRKVRVKNKDFIPEIGVLKSQDGKELPEGKLLAEEGEKGIRRKILTPGTYAINPHEFDVERHPAIRIKAGYVGVVEALTGDKMPPGQLLAKKGQKGVREDVLLPGTYFINPYEYRIVPFEIRMQLTSFSKAGMADAGFEDQKEATASNQIDFPSNDAFDITMEMSNLWHVPPEEAPIVYVTIGTLKDAYDKIVIPQARSVSRIEGSKYSGKDFITERREDFQKQFARVYAERLAERNIICDEVLVRAIIPPVQLAEPIKAKQVAVEEKLHKIQEEKAELARQELENVNATAQAQIERIGAEIDKEIAQINAERDKLVAGIDLQTANIIAQIKELKGQALADAEKLRKTGEAYRYEKIIESFGNVGAFINYQLAPTTGRNIHVVILPVGQMPDGSFQTPKLQDILKLQGQPSGKE